MMTHHLDYVKSSGWPYLIVYLHKKNNNIASVLAWKVVNPHCTYGCEIMIKVFDETRLYTIQLGHIGAQKLKIGPCFCFIVGHILPSCSRLLQSLFEGLGICSFHWLAVHLHQVTLWDLAPSCFPRTFLWFSNTSSCLLSTWRRWRVIPLVSITADLSKWKIPFDEVIQYHSVICVFYGYLGELVGSNSWPAY